jgi:hypothetical protein
VTAVHRPRCGLPGSPGLTIGELWELGSRWSPPRARICLLFVCRDGEVVGVESAVIAAQQTVCRLQNAVRLSPHPDGSVSDAAVETFVANLGHHRSQPPLRQAG